MNRKTEAFNVIARLYWKARSEGTRASTALWEARTMAQWEVLESAGLVRLRFVPDDEAYDDSYLETWGLSAHRLECERKKLWELIERDGVWSLLGQYRLIGGDWETGDAVCGFVGTDRNGAEPDIASVTIDCLRDALKKRCRECRRPGSTIQRVA